MRKSAPVLMSIGYPSFGFMSTRNGSLDFSLSNIFHSHRLSSFPYTLASTTAPCVDRIADIGIETQLDLLGRTSGRSEGPRTAGATACIVAATYRGRMATSAELGAEQRTQTMSMRTSSLRCSHGHFIIQRANFCGKIGGLT